MGKENSRPNEQGRRRRRKHAGSGSNNNETGGLGRVAGGRLSTATNHNFTPWPETLISGRETRIGDVNESFDPEIIYISFDVA